MTINALQASGWAYPALTGSSPAYGQSDSNTGSDDNAASSTSTALQSTQVTLSASATLQFYNLPANLGVQPTVPSNPWNVSLPQSGSTPTSAQSLLGAFAENELASQLTSPNALNGATVSFNNFSSRTTSDAGTVQQAQSQAGGNLGASIQEESESVTLQGSGDITLANGEVIPFDAELSTSASIVAGSATQTATGGVANSNTASPAVTTASLSPFSQSSDIAGAGAAISSGKGAGVGLGSEWASLLDQYKLLLNLFDSVKAATDPAQSTSANSVAAESVGSSGSGAIQDNAANTASVTGNVAVAGT